MTSPRSTTEAAALNIVLGVAGGIAAYKSASLLRLLVEAGYRVTVVPTEAALHFVGQATWEALSGQPIAGGLWQNTHEVPHVALGRSADLVIVAPATADLLGRAAHGLADDLLTNVLLTATCPVVLAPAMHTEMWENAATRANVELLRSRGVTVVEPDEGRLTGADSGKGRLPEPDQLFATAVAILRRAGLPRHDLAGRRVVVTAGGTREPLDPVRFLGNRSSGRQGFAMAAAAARRGADVVLISANSTLPTPAGVKRIEVGSAAELQAAVTQEALTADVVVMAAAVADFRPVQVQPTKIKKNDLATDAPAPIALERTDDILAGLVREARNRSTPQVIVGFAAETVESHQDLVRMGRDKRAAKGCDLLVCNQVGGVESAFESLTNEVVIVSADDRVTQIARADKDVVADAVWDHIVDVTAAP